MSAAAPLQNTAAKPQPPTNSTHAGLPLQRKCACGLPTSSLSGECAKCTINERVQTKLAVGASNDPLEREADRVADQVLAAQANAAVSGAPPRIQRFTEQATGQADTAPASVDQVLASPGRPLEPALRQDMQQRFGYDFSRVRVHSSGTANRSAHDLNASAYTTGTHIVFGANQFSPNTLDGRRLIAHELTHVVQQSGSDRIRVGTREDKPVADASNRPIVGRSPLVIARKPRTSESRAAPRRVEMMAREEARALLAAYVWKPGLDDTYAALNAIEAMLDMRFTLGNASKRLQMLAAAFSLLDQDGAAVILEALTKPEGARQLHLRERFGRLDHRFREPLLMILQQRSRAASTGTKKADQADEEPQTKYQEGRATWVELPAGVFAYVPEPGKTLSDVAAYVSRNPDLLAGLIKLNRIPADKPVPTGMPVIVPVEFIDRERARGELSKSIRHKIDSVLEKKAYKTRVKQYGRVKPGLRGRGIYGLIPVTTLALTFSVSIVVEALLKLIKGAAYAISFAAGIVHGFFASMWDTASSIAKVIYDVLSSLTSLRSAIKKLIGDLKNLSGDLIKDMVGEWAAGWDKKLNSRSPFVAGHAHGYLTGYVMAEAAMFLVTFGEATALKGAFWASGVGKAVKASRAFAEAEKYIAKATKAGGKIAEVIDKVRKSRAGGVVKVADAAVWTAKTIGKVLNLPGDIALYVINKALTHAKQLGPFFERIGKLTKRAKKWLFGCRSPCKWDVDEVEDILKRLPDNKDIEGLAASGKAATRETVDEFQKRGGIVKKPPEGHSGDNTPTRVKPDPTTARPTGLPSIRDADILSQQSLVKQFRAYPSAPKHHVFPQELQAWFEKKFQGSKENIHEYTLVLPEGTHQAIHKSAKGKVVKGVKEPDLIGWNQEWKNFKLQHEDASVQQIFEEAGRLMKKYNISDAKIVSYPQKKRK